jgi:hypothetical protein
MGRNGMMSDIPTIAITWASHTTYRLRFHASTRSLLWVRCSVTAEMFRGRRGKSSGDTIQEGGSVARGS